MIRSKSGVDLSSSSETVPVEINSPRRHSMSEVPGRLQDQIGHSASKILDKSLDGDRRASLKLRPICIQSPLERLTLEARQIITNVPPMPGKGSWLIRRRDPLDICRSKVRAVCKDLLNPPKKNRSSARIATLCSFLSEYDKEHKAHVEKSGSPEFIQIQRFVLLARKVAATVVFDKESPLVPELTITEEVEYIRGPGLTGLRFESVPSNDYTQMRGPHCDDMMSAYRFEDGTACIVCTDGEGAKAASDAFSHIFNAALQTCWLKARETVSKKLRKGKRDIAQAEIQQMLKAAMNLALDDMRSFVLAKGMKPEDRAWQGASTLACAMTIADPQKPDVCWVVGINIYDSPVIVIEPDTGLVTVHQQTIVNSNLDTANTSYDDYIYRTKQAARPEVFIRQHHANALVLVMTDGVTDCLPKLDDQTPQEEQNEQLSKALEAVICNPYFDSWPMAQVKKNISLAELEKLGKNPREKARDLTPSSIARRLENYVKWRSSDLRRAQEVINSIAALIERQARLQDKNLTGLIVREKIGAVRILPESALQDYAEKTAQDYKHIHQLLQVSRLGQANLSPREEASCRQQFPDMDNMPELVMVPVAKLDELLRTREATLWEDRGAKTDGVSLVVARAVHSQDI